VKKVGVTKMNFVPPANDGLYDRLKSSYYDRLKEAKRTSGKAARADAVALVKSEAMTQVIPAVPTEGAPTADRFSKVWHDLEEHVVRDLILTGTRPDGRDYKTLRDLHCEVGHPGQFARSFTTTYQSKLIRYFTERERTVCHRHKPLFRFC